LQAPRARRGAIRLLECGYAASTLKKYKSGVRRFVLWCSEFGRVVRSLDQLDLALAEYFDAHASGCSHDGTKQSRQPQELRKGKRAVAKAA
jgi:hypothetical protein